MKKNSNNSTAVYRIFITGGHMTPALAVADELHSRGWQIFYIGRKHALEGDKAVSQEVVEVPRHGFRFLALTTGRLQRRLTMHTIISLLKMPIGFVQSIYYLVTYRPKVVLSFGGYIAVPVVFISALFRIPIIIHEQTRVVGMSNRLLSMFAKKICVTWTDTTHQFAQDKSVVTGNPIRKEILTVKEVFELSMDKPLLYITGGNLGSHALNEIVEKSLPGLLAHFSVIHQCGNSKLYKDFDRLSALRATLPKELRDRYVLVEYVGASHIGWVMKEATLLLTRAGANTVYEVILLHKPAVFVPLPWAGNNEQFQNAKYLVDKNAGVLLPQDQLTPENLIKMLDQTYQRREEIKKELNEISKKMPHQSAKQIADVVESVM